jgi:MFS family permease
MPSEETKFESQPHLFADRSFWGMTATQFLGAFNDNLYKQLMLLLAIAVPVVAVGAADAGGPEVAGAGQGPASDIQGWATLVFSLPFVLFSGFAGYLSDRQSKTPIIVLSKVAEIAIMSLGVAAFYFYDLFGMAGTWIVLFLMGSQSTFFGPGKYGILPELFRPRDLPRANAIILMSTFLAIIFGMGVAGFIRDSLGTDSSPRGMWLGIMVCVGIAIAGTLTSLLIRKVPPAQPHIPLTADCWAISRDVYAMLRNDRQLLGALLVSSVFWMVSGIAVPTVNRLGLEMLGLSPTVTGFMAGNIALGIMLGAPLASIICRRGYGDASVNVGLWGIFGSLGLLGIWTAGGSHWLGVFGSVAALISLGTFAAIYAIPIQVFLQDRPPSSLKGRMIATMNQANFVGILISGPLYQLFEAIAGGLGIPICSVFWMMGLLVLPLAIFFRLDSQTAATSSEVLLPAAGNPLP